MSNLQIVTSLLGQAILWAVLLVVSGNSVWQKIPQRKFVLVVLVALAITLPVHGLTAGEWLRSVIGDPSIPSLILFADITSRRVWQFSLVQDESRKWLLRGIALAGLMFYPLALGATVFDPYAWGYLSQMLAMMLAAFSAMAWWKGLRNLAVILLLPVLAYHLKMLESVNLWDYLIDPVVFVYAVLQSWVLPGLGNLKSTIKS